jgi:hypothetical protein
MEREITIKLKINPTDYIGVTDSPIACCGLVEEMVKGFCDWPKTEVEVLVENHVYKFYINASYEN